MTEAENLKEKLLVLAKTYPIVSKKYEHLVCSAGITDKFELRRVYPVPWEVFWGGGFKKKSWIEYSKKEDKPSDHRSESRRIIPDSIKQLEEAEFAEIKKMLDEKLTTMEELNKINHREVSLGIIKPTEIMDFVDEDNKHFDKNTEKGKQQTLGGGSAVKVWIPPKVFSYVFKCCPNCKGHKIMCEDWELMALYRNCDNYRQQGKYKNEAEVISKVKEKFLKALPEKRDLYFIVGTHYRFDTYIIVGVIYPKNSDKY